MSLVLGVDAVFSHATAAAIFGAPIPAAHGARVHVAVPDDGEAPQRREIVGHRARLPADHVTLGNSLPVTTAPRTFLDLAGVLPLADLVAVGDFIVGWKWCSLDELDTVISWGRGRRGVQRARLARTLVDGRAASRPESLIRVWCVRGGLPKPEVNGWIRDPEGRPRYRGDLVFRKERVIVEYDGGHHRTPSQFAADLRRRNDLLQWGWRVVHIEASMLARPHEVVDLIRRALESRPA